MKIVERSLGFTRTFGGQSGVCPPSASEDVSMRTRRSSTSKVVVAYVSMTCTPFRSSIVSPACAARSRTYSFRAIRWGSAGRGCTAAPLHASGSYGAPTFPSRVRGLALTDVLARVEADAGKALEILKEYVRSEEHTSELQSQSNLVCRLLLETKKTRNRQ